MRLTLANSAVGTAGINAGIVTNPQVNRTALSLLNLNNTFYIGSTNSISSTLPVVWISFTATKVDEKVLLNWSTASDINHNYFTVQRSKNGTNCDNIKEIPKSVNSTGVSTYTAYDETPYSDISYYRLQQTDMDGKHSYSVIRSINMNMLASTISVYPNPATERIIVTLPAIGKNEVTILNSEGQVIRPSVLTTGTTVSFNISNLKNGYYFVHIKNSSVSGSKKILIKH